MSELALPAPPALQSRATLLDLLDRVLGKGVVAYGDIVLSIADLDLVYLNLRAVLSSIGTLERKENGRMGEWENGRPTDSSILPQIPPFVGGALEPEEERERGRMGEKADSAGPSDAPAADAERSLPPHSLTSHSPIPSSGGKLEMDPQKTAQGLAKLAMTLINLLRKLMERQAIRRMEAGTLTPEQLERAGQAFQRLDDQIKELCKQFDLKEEDLNLDLGPLGKLV